ncbi:MAG: tRNA (adenosine(37)-N6)-threonylcarbamoyltransferase complex ATPase subunit type 1 TsaE [Pseudomonadota bacterium]
MINHLFSDTKPFDLERTLEDVTATNSLACAVAQYAKAGQVLALWGDLGVGKTTFARAFIRQLTHDDQIVASPTYTLIQTYSGPGYEIWHIDLYRLQNTDELLELGLEEAIGEALCLIEWPERMGMYLPHHRVDIGFGFHETCDQAREVRIRTSAPF